MTLGEESQAPLLVWLTAVTPSLHQAGHCLLWDAGWSLDEGWVANGVDAFLQKVHLQVCIQGCVFFTSQPEVGFQISSADSVCFKFCLFVWIGQSEVKTNKPRSF